MKTRHKTSLVQTNRFQPWCEPLEDRSLLACTFIDAFPVAIIVGDGQPNEITINDDGTNSFLFVGDNIHVTCRTGNETMTTSFDGPYTEIRVVTGKGSDTVTYNLFPGFSSPTTSRGVTRKLDVQLSKGKDHFVGNLKGTVLGPGLYAGTSFPGSSYSLDVKGGLGNDNITYNASLNIDVGGGLRLNQSGDAGDDRLKVIYEGVVDNPLFLNADGVEGNDKVAVTMAFKLGSEGTLGTNSDKARVLGRRGDDRLTFWAEFDIPFDEKPIFAELNGGPGRDRCDATPNVKVLNCP